MYNLHHEKLLKILIVILDVLLPRESNERWFGNEQVPTQMSSQQVVNNYA